jgi:hypothetical protein
MTNGTNRHSDKIFRRVGINSKRVKFEVDRTDCMGAPHMFLIFGNFHALMHPFYAG